MVVDMVIWYVPVLANTMYKEMVFTMWIEKETKISEISALLEDGFEIEVDSPDGYVPVTHFVDKGMWHEYVLSTTNGIEVRCNENHLFETQNGWVFAKDLVGKSFEVLTKNGYSPATVTHTGTAIPIVDIAVDHPNHRYYTNGISSHNTGVGKSLFMCHHAANCLSQGKSVLYITCEMAEERIAERIDANLMDTPLDDLKVLPKNVYDAKMRRIQEKTKGKLIVKEYPTASANVNHFRILLEELKLKKNFKPDVIFIDYLNICASARIKMNASVGSYSYIKSIAEELRGMAVEQGVPIFSATQTNRTGFCLDPNTMVNTKNGDKCLKNVVVGDELLSDIGYNLVKKVYPTKPTKRYIITTESGKTIICSEDHMFPTGKDKAEKSIASGLGVADTFFTK